MTQQFMQYNQESGEKAGGSGSLSEGGAYICDILTAEYIKAKSGTHGIEFSFKTEAGQKAQFVKVYYMKQDNTEVKGGQSILNAMMGLLGIQGLSFTTEKRKDYSGNDVEVYAVSELEGKRLGIFLQKKLFTKNDNSDGYSFEIKVPYDPSTGKTLKEVNANQPAKTIEMMTNTYKDSDERNGDNFDNSYGGFEPAGPDIGNGNPY